MSRSLISTGASICPTRSVPRAQSPSDSPRRWALSDALGERARIFDSRAGLHLLVDFPSVEQGDTHRIVRQCLREGVAIYSAAPYYRRPPANCQLILGFTLPDEESIVRGAKILADSLQSV